MTRLAFLLTLALVMVAGSCLGGDDDNPEAPTIEGLSIESEGRIATLSADVSISEDTLAEAIIRWGDGATQTITIEGSSDEITATHAYVQDGEYSVGLEVRSDADARASRTVTAVIEEGAAAELPTPTPTATAAASPTPAPTPTPPPPPRVPTAFEVTATEEYRGEKQTGFVAYCPSAQNSAGSARRVLLTVGGLGSEGAFTDPSATCAGSNEWQQEASRLGFDLYFLAWSDSTDLVQRNAFVLTALIEDLASKEWVAADDEFAIVGVSLGGLISRYGLTYLESQGRAHHADLFITVDSPLQGAYIPIGIQHLAQYFADVWGIAAAREALESEIGAPMPRQVLIYHIDAAEGSTATADHAELFGELEAMGGYPQAPGLQKVAMSNGRGDGEYQAYPPGFRLLHWRSDKVDVGGLGSRFERTYNAAVGTGATVTITPTRNGHSVRVVVFTAILNIFDRTFNFRTRAQLVVLVGTLQDPEFRDSGPVFSATPIFELNGTALDLTNAASVERFVDQAIRDELGAVAESIYGAVSGLFVPAIARSIRDSSVDWLRANPQYGFRQVVLPASHSYTGGPGGQSNRTSAAVEALRESGLGDFPFGQPKTDHNFIPTVSALGLDLDPGEPIPEDPNGPFDRLYWEEVNLPHVGGSESDWIRQEIAALVDVAP